MKKILLALALLLPTEAAAATWRKAGESLDEKTTGWVDVSSIRTTKSGKTAWVRLNLDTGAWATSFIAVRCSVKTYYEAKIVYYEPDGNSSNPLGKTLEALKRIDGGFIISQIPHIPVHTP